LGVKHNPIPFSLRLKFTLLSIIFPTMLWAQPDWQLRKDENGIKVFTKDVAGYSLKAGKAITIFDAPLESCVSVLKDVPHLVDLFPNCSEAKPLGVTGDTLQRHYLRFKAPWPVTDRDAAMQYSYKYNAKSRSVRVMATGIPNSYPRQESAIRLTKGYSIWTFTAIGDGKTRLDYEFQSDPGGAVPAWLANSTVIDTPMDMLTNFHRLVKLEKHRNKSYAFIRQ
jgi:hypothetical protein